MQQLSLEIQQTALFSPPSRISFSRMTALSPGPNYAARLNYDCLLRIFEQLASLSLGDKTILGGAFYGWTSSLRVGSCVRVCRQWRAAAEKVLYRSCIIISSSSATAFLRTFASRPELAVNVNALVVGLSYAQTYPTADSDDFTGATQSVSSGILVRVVAACPQLMHLQIRPLHASCRSELLPAVLSKPLVSLICCPHLPRANVPWTVRLVSPRPALLTDVSRTVNRNVSTSRAISSKSSPLLPPSRISRSTPGL